MISAWDPGDTTGYAAWDEAGNLLVMSQCPLEDVPAVWKELTDKYGKMTVAIVEDFILFAKRAKSQVGSRMKASQGIGMVKALAATDDVEVVMQRADIKEMTAKHFQISVPSNHAESHRYDAFLHGSRWLMDQGRVKTPLQLMKEAEHGNSTQGSVRPPTP